MCIAIQQTQKTEGTVSLYANEIYSFKGDKDVSCIEIKSNCVLLTY